MILKHVLIPLSLALFLTEPANAVCFMGLGGDCPISDSEAARQIEPLVNGKLYGSFRLPTVIISETAYSFRYNGKSNIPQQTEKMQRVLNIINNKENCSDIKNILGGLGSWDETCALVGVLNSRGLAGLEIKNSKITNNQGNSTVTIRIVLKLTELGQNLAKGQVLRTSEPNVIRLATAHLRFVKILRSSTSTFGGTNISEVQFQYNIVPNVWAHVEKFLDTDGLPSLHKTTSVTFQKWSDGWKLIGRPGL